MMLTQLADVARKAGVKTFELPGWRTRGHGQMLGVRTVTCHHTANGGAPGLAPSLTVVQNGRPGLTGPLAHYLLAKDGTVYVVAAGLCYHAGVSLRTDYTNEYAVGIEAEAVGVPGTKGDWPQVQMDAYHRLCRALIAEFHLSVNDVRGHKETCSPRGRKSDPDFDMPAFRAAVLAVDLNPKPAVEADMQWGDEIKLSKEDAKWWGDPYKEGDAVTVGMMIRFPTMARRVEKELADFKVEQEARQAEILAAIHALATDGA